MKESMFGYKILPFQHGREGDEDVGTFAVQHPHSHLQTASTIVRPAILPPGKAFLELMAWKPSMNSQTQEKQLDSM